MSNNTFCVITTINPPSPAVVEWERRFGEKLIVIGDKKTPDGWKCDKAYYIHADADTLPFKSAETTPHNHYARKNIGYLMAMLNPLCECVYDTDDDNAPLDNWKVRNEGCAADQIHSEPWFNIYDALNGIRSWQLWPRGFPLKHVRKDPYQYAVKAVPYMTSPIQQGLVDLNADTDAIFRLTAPMTTPIDRLQFLKRRSIALAEGTWSPFNSQSTWWFKDAFPLMYLPVTATFRMTDIWRSFVAQRCLWAMGKSVVFHSPAEVVQVRNEHDLLRDFESELPGYLHNEKIAERLSALTLDFGQDSACENMRTCYQMMVDEQYLKPEEMDAVDTWIEDVRKIHG